MSLLWSFYLSIKGSKKMSKKLRVLTLIGALCLSCSAFADRTPDEITNEMYSIDQSLLNATKICVKEARGKGLVNDEQFEYVNKCIGSLNNGMDLYSYRDISNKLESELKDALKKQGVPESDINILVKGMDDDFSRRFKKAWQ